MAAGGDCKKISDVAKAAGFDVPAENLEQIAKSTEKLDNSQLGAVSGGQGEVTYYLEYTKNVLRILFKKS